MINFLTNQNFITYQMCNRALLINVHTIRYFGKFSAKTSVYMYVCVYLLNRFSSKENSISHSCREFSLGILHIPPWVLYSNSYIVRDMLKILGCEKFRKRMTSFKYECMQIRKFLHLLHFSTISFITV